MSSAATFLQFLALDPKVCPSPVFLPTISVICVGVLSELYEDLQACCQIGVEDVVQIKCTADHTFLRKEMCLQIGHKSERTI